MILRRVARPLLASIFVYGGINALRDAEGHAKVVDPFLQKALAKVDDVLPDGVPRDPVTLVRIDAAVKVGAGLALASGRMPRLAAFALLGSMVPTTIAGHPFWQAEDPATKQRQVVGFLKNAGVAGGLLLAVGDTSGKPSLGWRARRAAKKAGKRAGKVLPD